MPSDAVKGLVFFKKKRVPLRELFFFHPLKVQVYRSLHCAMTTKKRNSVSDLGKEKDKNAWMLDGMEGRCETEVSERKKGLGKGERKAGWIEIEQEDAGEDRGSMCGERPSV